MTLRELLDGAAADLADVEVDQSATGTTWSRAGRPFAVLSADGSVAEFSLDSRVAAAATRTPDTRPADRGPGWVRLSPKVPDARAEDRAKAWFVSAYRGQPQDQG